MTGSDRDADRQAIRTARRAFSAAFEKGDANAVADTWTDGAEYVSEDGTTLPVNKAGVIRGNYYDGLTDSTTPVYGSVDPKSQRAAWTNGKKTDRVFDAGISNLTGEQCPVLVHIGKDRTQQWLLVRVQQPVTGK